MPLTKYTYKNQKLLESFKPIPNFSANSFTLFNKKTGQVIVDAIKTDNEGNVIFKDINTEIYLKDLVGKAQSLKEDINIDGSFTLYFTDKFNKQYSLGEIYKILFTSQPKNLVYWFGKRASRKLNEGMDLNIVANYTKSIKDVDLLDPTKDVIKVELTNAWKNKWIDIPCLEVITPDYVNDKFASISATVIFKIKTNKPIITGFRIYDATAGLELMRTIHTSERSPGKFISYTVPMHYQGELPDTKQSSKTSFTGLTYQDIQNTQFEEGQEKGKEVSKNPDKYDTIPETQHIIKLQWVTCDLAIELDNLGNTIGNFGRFFDDSGDTSLDVTLFSGVLNKDQVIQLNGSIKTDFLENGVTLYNHNFETVPLGLQKEYSIAFTTNKNINISLIKKSLNGFVIEWSKSIKGLIIDWNIIYNIKEGDILNLETLNDPKRALNHFLFPDKQIATDFCNEVTDIGDFEFFPIEVIEEFEPDCVCCDCCTDLTPKVNFVLATGGDKPTPDNNTFTLDYNPDFVSSVSSESINFLTGQFDNNQKPVLTIGNNQFFNFEEIGDLAGLKNVSTFIDALSGSTNIPKPDNNGNLTVSIPTKPPLLSTVGNELTIINPIWNVLTDSINNGQLLNGELFADNSTGFSIKLFTDEIHTEPLWLTSTVDINSDPIFAISTNDILTTFPIISTPYSKGEFMGKVTLFTSVSLGHNIYKIDPKFAINDFYFTAIMSSGKIRLWNDNPNHATSIPYAKDLNGNIIAYKVGDKYAPDPSLFRFNAIVTDFENDKCRSGIYVDLKGPFGGVGNFDSQYIIDEGFGGNANDFDINYDTFSGFNTNTVSTSANTIIYSNAIKISGFGAVNPFFRKDNTYYVVIRSSIGVADPIVYLFEHDISNNIGSLNVAGLPGKLHLFKFFSRQEDPNAIDGKEFVMYEWTPIENVDYADLHIDDLNINFPIDLVAITDKNPLIKIPNSITNALLSRDLINKRSEFITNFPENEPLINNYNLLSGETGITGTTNVTTAILDSQVSGGPISGAPISGAACPGLGLFDVECSFLFNIEAILRFPDRLTRLEQIYTDNIVLLLKGRFNSDTTNQSVNSNDFAIVSQLTVGVNDTVNVVKIPLTPCTEIQAPSAANVNQDLDMKQDEWFEIPTEDLGTITDSFIVKKTLTLSDMYESNFIFKGIDLVSEEDLVKHEEAINRAFEIGLENLKYDKKQQFESLPAQLISDNLIDLDIPFDSSYSSLFEQGTTFLKVNNPLKLKTIVVPSDGFLGVKAFKHNIVIFDPRPNVIKTPEQRPLFPGFDPIYQKKSIEQILEHIYTTIYPTTNIPAFPNFRIGDIAINGEVYNPLYDYRNYRLSGYYDSTQTKNNADLFRSTPMRNINGSYVNSVYFKIGSKYYTLVTDLHTSGAIITSRFGNKIQKVKPSTLKFERISKTLFDFNANATVIV